MPKFFICYHRQDSEYAAQMIYQKLISEYDADSVVFGVGAAPPGADYRAYARDQVGSCDALLAIIGDRWLEIFLNGSEDPHDSVRIEIQAALERQMPVVLVLVGDAEAPTEDELPPGFGELSCRQALEVRTGSDLSNHLARLVRRLGVLRAEETEADRLIDVLYDSRTDHRQRAHIGRRLAKIGDPRSGIGLWDDGLPEFEWCEVDGGMIELALEAGSFLVDPFRISKYAVTRLQYAAFIEAADGYSNSKWWEDLEQPGAPLERPGPTNHPVTHVNWYEAVAFCRWVADWMGRGLRLPTEWEWQQAATAGDAGNQYPWGQAWDASRVNGDSKLPGEIAVGMYPHGASPVGAMDMSGNVWEWCLNEYGVPRNTKVGGNTVRVLRGGSCRSTPGVLRAAYRLNDGPARRLDVRGFRVVWAGSVA